MAPYLQLYCFLKSRRIIRYFKKWSWELNDGSSFPCALPSLADRGIN